MKRKYFYSLSASLLCLPLSACSIAPKTSDRGYLNHNYALSYCGDIHDGKMYDQEVLNRYPDYVDYLQYFDKSECYMQYHCVGTSYDDFHCIGSIKIVDKKGNVLLHNDSFDCWTNVDLYYGEIKYTDKVDEEQIGKIYVFSPYWCRIQLPCYFNDTEQPVLVTFEFWKTTFNELPDFLKNE